MNERAILAVLVGLSLASGRCGSKSHEPDARVDTGGELLVSGEVHHKERILLPPGATLLVVAEDGEAPPATAESSRSISGSPPYSFTLRLDALEASAPERVMLRAEIWSGGELTFASPEPEPAFDAGAPRDDVSILVVPVPAEAD